MVSPAAKESRLLASTLLVTLCTSNRRRERAVELGSCRAANPFAVMCPERPTLARSYAATGGCPEGPHTLLACSQRSWAAQIGPGRNLALCSLADLSSKPASTAIGLLAMASWLAARESSTVLALSWVARLSTLDSSLSSVDIFIRRKKESGFFPDLARLGSSSFNSSRCWGWQYSGSVRPGAFVTSNT